MSLVRYLGEGNMELLKREVESSTGIQLKAHPRWLINQNRLREQQETGKRGSAIVITVQGETKAKRLCVSGLRFGKVIKIVKRYWEAGPGLVCTTCYGIGQQRMGNCGDRPEKYVICVRSHKVENHQCGVMGRNKGKKKICVHVTPRCANCMGAHAANSSRCTSRHKVEISARKGKKTKEIQKEKEMVSNTGNKVDKREKEASPQLDTDMELEGEDWAPSPTPALEYEVDESPDEIPEGEDHSEDY